MTPLVKLNDTTLLFLPPTILGNANVAQVTIKTERKLDVNSISTFFLSQQEISELIIRVVCAHNVVPLPNSLRFEGDDYLLTATTKPWPFGKMLKLKWGDETVKPCEDKWTFMFQAKSQKSEL